MCPTKSYCGLILFLAADSSRRGAFTHALTRDRPTCCSVPSRPRGGDADRRAPSQDAQGSERAPALVAAATAQLRRAARLLPQAKPASEGAQSFTADFSPKTGRVALLGLRRRREWGGTFAPSPLKSFKGTGTGRKRGLCASVCVKHHAKERKKQKNPKKLKPPTKPQVVEPGLLRNPVSYRKQN